MLAGLDRDTGLAKTVLALLAAEAGGRGAARRVPGDARRKERTRWCAAHAVANAAIAVATARDAASVLVVAPRECLAPTPDRFPIALAVGVHVYHVACYRQTLTREDMLHHVVFAFGLGAAGYEYATAATNAMLFFLTGLPGGLVYALVAARRVGCRAALACDEPRASAVLSTCLRAPGILAVVAAMLRAQAEGPRARALPTWVLVAQSVLPAVNAVHYARQSVTRAASAAAKRGA